MIQTRSRREWQIASPSDVNFIFLNSGVRSILKLMGGLFKGTLFKVGPGDVKRDVEQNQRFCGHRDRRHGDLDNNKGPYKRIYQ